MKTVLNFTDAEWYVYEITDKSGKQVEVGVTKYPDLVFSNPIRWLKKELFGLTFEVLAGFEEESQAREAANIVRDE